MRAVNAWMVRNWGPPEDMSFEDVADKQPSLEDVLVDVRAVGVNFFDALVIEGKYQVRPQLPFIPGVEGSGVVLSAPQAARVRPGDRIAFLSRFGSGTYAEQSDCDPGFVVPIPDAMSFEDAAALICNFATAHLALHRRAQLQPGETLLVHAGAGGVGSAAIQLGRAAGARVIATAGSNEKTALCLSLGADVAVNYHEADFVQAVKDFTGSRGADVIVDPVGGDVFDRSTRCVAFEGRIVPVGFTSGRIPQAAISHLVVKSYSVLGVHLSLQSTRTPEVVSEVMADLLRLFEEGAIRPRISATYPLAAAPAALRAVTDGRTTGKVVLTTHNA
jgi:NADPH2:quinone reductase